uniref:LAGLIDADG endonuclease n=1 Tax=Juglanconis juglandina TaxID=1940567 RepID=A0A291LJG1_9PEZI|nr:LAGLIDADG endonuclease [Juglanconis juglandina]
MWFHSVFASAGYCNAKKPKLHRFIGKGNKVLFIYKFKTYSFSSFTWLFDLFYPVQYSQVQRCDSRAEIIKFIPSRARPSDLVLGRRAENLYEYITPMSLATLFLSSVWEEKAIFSPKVMLDAPYYELNEKCLNNLALILKNKYNIETVAKINRRGLSLGSLDIKNSSVFVSVIKPHILPAQVHLLSRPNLKLNFLGNLQFKRFLTLSSIRSLSTNSHVKYKDVVVLLHARGILYAPCMKKTPQL